ncbi:MAG: pantetheine-phosphate adenylyltransferase [Oscillospiraceae bacterium]|jgi:pantetheine-phosphate adenylyltransferase|nr:pantetheine-phosphate adenylyltransferase [Oscillospiraceae bacterium]
MRTAICPGSFDPVTNGHMDILRRTAGLFDKVIVAVMDNYYKTAHAFTAAERVALLARCTDDLPNVEVRTANGLLADLAEKVGADAVVKGLRAVSDFETEFQQALTNKQINPQLETVFLAADAEWMFLSSSVVKQVAQYGGDIARFVPACIHDEVRQRLTA